MDARIRLAVFLLCTVFWPLANAGQIGLAAQPGQAYSAVDDLDLRVLRSPQREEGNRPATGEGDDDEPSACWLFETDTAASIEDLCSGLIAVPEGAMTHSGGVSGEALQLNGGKALVADDVAFAQSNGMTVFVWLRPDVAAWQIVLGKANRETDGFELGLTAAGRVFVRFNQVSSGNEYRLNSISSLAAASAEWTQVAAVFDGSNIAVYLNGVLDATLAASGLVPNNNQLPLSIGAATSGSSSYAGGLDQLRFYARALDGQEIAALFQEDAALDHAPIARDDEWPIEADRTLEIAAPGVLANDLDPDGDQLSVGMIPVSLPAHGALDLRADGSFTFVPDAGFSGSDEFRYEAVDSSGATAEATVALRIGMDSLPFDAGVVSGVASDAWTAIDLEHAYQSKVVLLTPAYDAGTPPLAVRMRDAGATRIEVQTVRLDRGAAPAPLSDVHYFVVEEGVYSAATNGVRLEAACYTASVSSAPGAWNGDPGAYQQSFIHPVVIGYAGFAETQRPVLFWSRGPQLGDPPDATTLQTGRHVGQDPLSARAPGPVCYVVVEAGITQLGASALSAGVSADTVRGMDDSPPYFSPTIGLAQTRAAVLARAGVDGGDGGFAVLHGSAPLAGPGAAMVIDEDQLGDTERHHTTEQVAWLVVGATLDTTAPEITVLGDNPLHVEAGGQWVDPGVQAWDAVDGGLNEWIETAGDSVDPGDPGEYTVIYSVVDAAGNFAQETRMVIVSDNTVPVITLQGEVFVQIETTVAWVEPGFTAWDSFDGDISAVVAISGDQVPTGMPGTYVIDYDVNDASGNAATTVQRVIEIVVPVPTATADGYALQEDGTLVVAAGAGLLANDFDPSGFTLTVDTVPAQPALHGTVQIQEDGSFSYTPFVNFNGYDAFSYALSNSAGGTASAEVTIEITPVNDPPFLIAAPAISGAAAVGGVLHADTGTWSDANDLQPGTLSFGFQWQRASAADGSGLTDIPGASSADYTVTEEDGDFFLSVRVVATDDGEGTPASQSASASSLAVVVPVCEVALPEHGIRDDVLVLINRNSIDSCAVGRHYAAARGLGRDALLEVSVPADYFLEWDEFRVLRDRIIKHLQDETLGPEAGPPVVCADGDAPWYCEASVTQIRNHTRIRYLVMTRGMPTRVSIADSTLNQPSPTSLDNYLRHWLVHYFAVDEPFFFDQRARDFAGGRGQRAVDPATDQELIIGRIDGIDGDSAMRLVDRTLAAESNGVYGRLYGSQYGEVDSTPDWMDHALGLRVYGDATNAWRYQRGVFGESRPECIDYLGFSHDRAEGKTPEHCVAQITGSGEPGPSDPRGRQPTLFEALLYLGELDNSKSATGDFADLLQWRRAGVSGTGLCADSADPVACRVASTDPYGEIDTSVVGVADGFVGYNFQSFTLSYRTAWPTGWHSKPSRGSVANLAFPSLRDDSGQDDNYSLWFVNRDEVDDPRCFATSDFDAAPDMSCRDELYMQLQHTMELTPRTVDSATPQTLRVGLWHSAEGLDEDTRLHLKLFVTATDGSEVVYGNYVVGTVPAGNSGWAWSERSIVLDPAQHPLAYDQIAIELYSDVFVGAVGIDGVIVEEDDIDIATNGTFAEGMRGLSVGDYAATFLSRLNGVAMWGSISHHESGGVSFSSHPVETMIYFFRGLPLGDAVWLAEYHNSGLLEGDPLYSPVAVRLAYPNEWDYVTGTVTLGGSARNGRDSSVVTTSFAVDYCPGTDFHDCDQVASWLPTGVSGAGGFDNGDFGQWDSSGLAPGPYVLRLDVHSSNAGNGLSQSFYDYLVVTVYDPAADDDGDGLSNSEEIAVYDTDPSDYDMDDDGLSDRDESLAGTDPRVGDTDGDGLPDAWEVSVGTDPLVADAAADPDGDGLDNFAEFSAGADPFQTDSDGDGLDDALELGLGTRPDEADSDGDGLGDGMEYYFILSDPLDIDSDNDALDDGWEYEQGLDPLSTDGSDDPDGDGVPNVLEYLRATDPLDAGSTPLLLTWYVNPSSGSAGATGTLADPFASIAEAQAVSSDGDSIILAAGDYDVSGATFEYNLRIAGGEPGVRLHAGAVTVPGPMWLQLADVETEFWGAFEFSAARNTTIERVRLATSSGIHLRDGSSLSLRNVAHITLGATVALQLEDDSQAELLNNAIYGYPTGIRKNSPDAVLRLFNSIIGGASTSLDGIDGQDVVRYNLIENGEMSGSDGNIAGDPQFVDPGWQDLHLQPGSAAIDAGDPEHDASLEPSPNGCRINLGAYGNTAEATTSASGC